MSLHPVSGWEQAERGAEAPLILKLMYRGERHRTRIPHPHKDFGYDALLNHARGLFRQLLPPGLDVTSLRMTYEDDARDTITINSESDWQDALITAAQEMHHHLRVSLSDPPTPPMPNNLSTAFTMPSLCPTIPPTIPTPSLTPPDAATLPVQRSDSITSSLSSFSFNPSSEPTPSIISAAAGAGGSGAVPSTRPFPPSAPASAATSVHSHPTASVGITAAPIMTAVAVQAERNPPPTNPFPSTTGPDAGTTTPSINTNNMNHTNISTSSSNSNILTDASVPEGSGQAQDKNVAQANIPPIPPANEHRTNDATRTTSNNDNNDTNTTNNSNNTGSGPSIPQPNLNNLPTITAECLAAVQNILRNPGMPGQDLVWLNQAVHQASNHVMPHVNQFFTNNPDLGRNLAPFICPTLQLAHQFINSLPQPGQPSCPRNPTPNTSTSTPEAQVPPQDTPEATNPETSVRGPRHIMRRGRCHRQHHQAAPVPGPVNPAPASEDNAAAAAEPQTQQCTIPATSQSEPSKHRGVRCDICQQADFTGVRYKDAVRRDFDMCERCEAQQPSWPFPLLKIPDPAQAPSRILTVLPPEDEIDYIHDLTRKHMGVICDGCDIGPITGTRFVCTHRHDYDLCAACEARDETGLPMLQIKKPSQAPKFFHVDYHNGSGIDRRHRHAMRRCWRQNHRRSEREIQRQNAQEERQRQQQPQQQQEQTQTATVFPPAHAPPMTPMPTPALPPYFPSVPTPMCHKPCMMPTAQVVPVDNTSSKEAVEAAAIKSAPKAVAEEKVGRAEGATESKQEIPHPAVCLSQAPPESPLPIPATPPPPAPTVDPAPPASPRSTPPRRLYSVRFVSDITFPDGTVVQPRMEFRKTWALQNNGSLPFPQDTHLAFSYGHQMSGPTQHHIGPINPGEDFRVTIPVIAPSQNSQYISCWQIQGTNPETERMMTIGNRIWIDLHVNDQYEDWLLLDSHTTPPQSTLATEDQMLETAATETLSNGGLDSEQPTELAASAMPDLSNSKTSSQAAPTDLTASLPTSSASNAPNHSTSAHLPPATLNTTNTNTNTNTNTPTPPSLDITDTDKHPVAPPALTLSDSLLHEDAQARAQHWSDQLAVLAQMGFSDTPSCIKALDSVHHDKGMEGVVDFLTTPS